MAILKYDEAASGYSKIDSVTRLVLMKIIL